MKYYAPPSGAIIRGQRYRRGGWGNLETVAHIRGEGVGLLLGNKLRGPIWVTRDQLLTDWELVENVQLRDNPQTGRTHTFVLEDGVRMAHGVL